MSPQVLQAHGLEPLKLGPKEVLSMLLLVFNICGVPLKSSYFLAI